MPTRRVLPHIGAHGTTLINHRIFNFKKLTTMYIKTIISVLLTILAVSCTEVDNDTNNSDNGEGSNNPTSFSSPQEAASAAQKDMLVAMKEVNFGISENDLRNAQPGTPLQKTTINWDNLLQADSNTTISAIATNDQHTVVPLVNGNNVVTIVSLIDKGGEYGIGGMGDKQLSSELNMVWRLAEQQTTNNIRIYSIPNLNAIVYEVMRDDEPFYFTSYDGNSLRQALNAPELIDVLRKDALRFQKEFGNQLKDNNLLE